MYKNDKMVLLRKKVLKEFSISLLKFRPLIIRSVVVKHNIQNTFNNNIYTIYKSITKTRACYIVGGSRLFGVIDEAVHLRYNFPLNMVID